MSGLLVTQKVTTLIIKGPDQTLVLDGTGTRYSTSVLDAVTIAEGAARARAAADAATGSAIASRSAADESASSATAAATARDAAIAGAAGYYATTTAALADGALTVGKYFATPVSGTNDAVILYRKDAGPVATEITRLPSSQGLATGLAGVLGGSTASAMDDEDYAIAFVNDNDLLAFGQRIDGTFIVPGLEVAGVTTLTTDDPDYLMAAVGEGDLVGFGQRVDGGTVVAAGGATFFPGEDPDYAEAFVDDKDQVVYGVRFDGTFAASVTEIAGATTSASDDPDYMWALVDNSESVVLGAGSDGAALVGGGGAMIYPSDDPAWAAVVVDPNDRVVAGIQVDGTIYTRTGAGSGSGGESSGRYADMSGIWIMGQSLGAGGVGVPLVSSGDTGWGNLMFARGVRTWVSGDHPADPQNRDAATMQLAPLVETVSGSLGETVATGLANHLKSTVVGRYAAVMTAGPAFLAAYSGASDRMILEITSADQENNVLQPIGFRLGGGYYATSIDNARRAVATAAASGSSFAVSAFVWMQGEANTAVADGAMYQTRWDKEAGTGALSRPAAQNWYRDVLIAHRAEWDAAVRALTGQPRPIPMLTYQTLGPAGEAQLMAAQSDPNIFMVGNHTWMPNAINARLAGDIVGSAVHLAADGYRWLGEQMGKVMARVLDGEAWRPLSILRASLAADRLSILVEFDVPRGPLVIDTDFVPEQRSGAGPYASLRGFQVLSYAAGTVATIASANLERSDAIRITLATALPTGGYYIRYGNAAAAGTVGTIASIRSGSATPTGQATTEIVFTGDLFTGKNLAVIMQEGAFFASTVAGSITARTAYLSSGNTVIQAENRLMPVTFTVGQTVSISRVYPYGNVRDSDREAALFTFTDTTYGNRQGKPYPLWNVCVNSPETAIKE